jgi:hypothetical protein
VIRQVMWTAWEDPGLGHLRLVVRDNGVIADGMVLGVADGRPFRLAYVVRCDAYWRVRYVRVGVPGEPPKTELLSDGEGNWATSDGRAVAYLEGCGYVDISETPYTNTLPIRRLGLAPGESADVSVAYFDGYELQPWPEPQRYTRLEEDDGRDVPVREPRRGVHRRPCGGFGRPGGGLPEAVQAGFRLAATSQKRVLNDYVEVTSE